MLLRYWFLAALVALGGQATFGSESNAQFDQTEDDRANRQALAAANAIWAFMDSCRRTFGSDTTAQTCSDELRNAFPLEQTTIRALDRLFQRLGEEGSQRANSFDRGGRHSHAVEPRSPSRVVRKRSSSLQPAAGISKIATERSRSKSSGAKKPLRHSIEPRSEAKHLNLAKEALASSAEVPSITMISDALKKRVDPDGAYRLFIGISTFSAKPYQTLLPSSGGQALRALRAADGAQTKNRSIRGQVQLDSTVFLSEPAGYSVISESERQKIQKRKALFAKIREEMPGGNKSRAQIEKEIENEELKELFAKYLILCTDFRLWDLADIAVVATTGECSRDMNASLLQMRSDWYTGLFSLYVTTILKPQLERLISALKSIPSPLEDYQEEVEHADVDAAISADQEAHKLQIDAMTTFLTEKLPSEFTEAMTLLSERYGRAVCANLIVNRIIARELTRERVKLEEKEASEQEQKIGRRLRYHHMTMMQKLRLRSDRPEYGKIADPKVSKIDGEEVRPFELALAAARRSQALELQAVFEEPPYLHDRKVGEYFKPCPGDELGPKALEAFSLAEDT